MSYLNLELSLADYGHRRRKPWELEILANFPPAARAIARISTGVLNMRWAILPPLEFMGSESAHKTARWLAESLKSPNDSSESFEGLISAVVRDLLCHLAGAIKRESCDGFRAFAAHPIAITSLVQSDTWNGDLNEPRYYLNRHDGGIEGLFEDQVFFVQNTYSSDDSVLRSPVEIAAPALIAWMSLFEYQHRETSINKPSTLIDFGDITKAELDEFRAYLEYDTGTTKSIGSKSVSLLELNPSGDAGLYLRYSDYLLRLIAMTFGLTPREFGITTADRQETVGASARSSFSDAILPVGRAVYRRLGKDLIDYYYPGYRLILNESEPRSEGAKAAAAAKLWDLGVLTLNQALVASGYEPIGAKGETRKAPKRP